jgi:hypothetical protein
MRTPIGQPFRNSQPLCTVQEKWLLKHDTTDFVVFGRRRFGLPVTLNSTAHLRKAGGTVFLTECLPSEAYGESRKMSEKATSNDEIERAVKLEK